MSDLFGSLGSGLGGLVKGLTSIMPKNDPDVQLFTSQSDIADLEKQREALFAEIGRQAVSQYGLESFGELAGRIRLVESNLADAKARSEAMLREKEEKEQAERLALAARTCPQCGCENAEGTKFCQECGARLDVRQSACPACGAGNPSGTKFCQECGAQLAPPADAPVACPACGAQNPPGTRFCGACGSRLE